jgi:hypothetical protein
MNSFVRFVRGGLALATLAAPLAVTGCAADTTDGELGSSQQAFSEGFGLPDGSAIEDLRLQGDGCPAGSAEAIITEDRQSFLVLFSEYEAATFPGNGGEDKNCTFFVKIRTPQGLSLQIAKVWYEGAVVLDKPGMRAEQRARYWWAGSSPPAREFRSEMTGPKDESYVFQDELWLGAFSRCNSTHELVARTRITIRNNQSKTGEGYINTTTAGGDVAMKFRFNPFWRSC